MFVVHRCLWSVENHHHCDSHKMARNMSVVNNPERGFAKSVLSLFYVSKCCGIIPFDIFAYKSYAIFMTNTWGKWYSIVCITLYTVYYHFILTNMYFIKPGTEAGKFSFFT